MSFSESYISFMNIIELMLNSQSVQLFDAFTDEVESKRLISTLMLKGYWRRPVHGTGG